MMYTSTAAPRYLLLLVVFIAPSLWAATGPVGHVSLLKRNVTATSESGTVRKLEKGDKVYRGERIATSKRSYVVMKFDDGTTFSLGQKSGMTVEAYAYGADPEEDRFGARILTGTFRFVTGLLSKRRASAMSVRVGSTATIGIRGTSVAGELDGEAATVVLMEPENKDESTSIVVYNEHGEVTVSEPGYGTEVPDANSPPSPVRRMKLRTIENLMRSLSTMDGAFSRPYGVGH